jgi:heptosyltransferase-3
MPGRSSRKAFLMKLVQNRKTIRELKNERYDVVINARAFPPSSNRVLRKLGSTSIAFDISEQSFWADIQVDYDLDEEEWINYGNLLKPLGIDQQDVRPSGSFHNFDAPNPMGSKSGYIVISPVSFDKDREWGLNNWKCLIRQLSDDAVHIALTGLPSHRSYIESITASIANPEFVKTLTNIQLDELGALMKDAALFLGIDSFPAHLALCLDKPAALLVNARAYYLKNFSTRTFASEARCMLPVIPSATFFDVEHTAVETLVRFCENSVDSYRRSESGTMPATARKIVP